MSLSFKKCPYTQCIFRAKHTGWCDASVAERVRKHCPVNGVTGYNEKVNKDVFMVNRKHWW